jgi:cytochrome oxidase Cu insertion factor (SCO1/SenC/PrrC family)
VTGFSSPDPGGGQDRQRRRPSLPALLVWSAAVVAVAAFALVATGVFPARSSAPAAPAAATPQQEGALARRLHGYPVDRRVPSLPMLNRRGRSTSLAGFRGKVVVLAPFLTLCGEVCPITTGAFIELQHTLPPAIARRVVFVEATVDPWRDSPFRLRAYSRLTGARFPLLTGSRQQVAHFWRFFGVGYRRVPEGKPPDIDWLTHRPLRFDVQHTDALFLIDPRGRERVILGGSATGMKGHLSSALLSLLSATGRTDLTHMPGWTIGTVERDVRYLLGHRAAAPGSPSG